jgi:hypothetical protein
MPSPLFLYGARMPITNDAPMRAQTRAPE